MTLAQPSSYSAMLATPCYAQLAASTLDNTTADNRFFHTPAVQPPYYMYWECGPPTPKAPQMTPHMAVPPLKRMPHARDHEGPPS